MADQRVSGRRACNAIGGRRMTVGYNSGRLDDAVLRERMMMISRERRRFGYRRLLALLRREGHVVNHKKFFRPTAKKSWRFAVAVAENGL